jgi:hypothetical protein
MSRLLNLACHEFGSGPHYERPGLAKRLSRRGSGFAKSAAFGSELVLRGVVSRDIDRNVVQ